MTTYILLLLALPWVACWLVDIINEEIRHERERKELK